MPEFFENCGDAKALADHIGGWARPCEGGWHVFSDARDVMLWDADSEIRYAIVDHASGFVWGVVNAKSPVDACQAVDEDNRDFGREYELVGRFDFANDSGYIVYAVAPDFDVTDGQDTAQCDAVPAEGKRVAFVKFSEE